jgi:hypothetical protein
MQLHLETDELSLLANLLMNRGSEVSRSSLDDGLLEMVLAHDLRFDSDELERVAALLATHEHSLKEALDRESNLSRKAEMQKKPAVLEHVLEKVDEACVMI